MFYGLLKCHFRLFFFSMFFCELVDLLCILFFLFNEFLYGGFQLCNFVLALSLQLIKLCTVSGFQLNFDLFILTIPLLIIIKLHSLLFTLVFSDIRHPQKQLPLEILFLHEGAFELAAHIVLTCLDLLCFSFNADDAVK